MNVQKDVKKLIAYSTIKHMGYLFMAVGLGTQLGLQAALFTLSITRLPRHYSSLRLESSFMLLVLETWRI